MTPYTPTDLPPTFERSELIKASPSGPGPGTITKTTHKHTHTHTSISLGRRPGRGQAEYPTGTPNVATVSIAARKTDQRSDMLAPRLELPMVSRPRHSSETFWATDEVGRQRRLLGGEPKLPSASGVKSRDAPSNCAISSYVSSWGGDIVGANRTQWMGAHIPTVIRTLGEAISHVHAKDIRINDWVATRDVCWTPCPSPNPVQQSVAPWCCCRLSFVLFGHATATANS